MSELHCLTVYTHVKNQSDGNQRGDDRGAAAGKKRHFNHLRHFAKAAAEFKTVIIDLEVVCCCAGGVTANVEIYNRFINSGTLPERGNQKMSADQQNYNGDDHTAVQLQLTGQKLVKQEESAKEYAAKTKKENLGIMALSP